MYAIDVSNKEGLLRSGDAEGEENTVRQQGLMLEICYTSPLKDDWYEHKMAHVLLMITETPKI